MLKKTATMKPSVTLDEKTGVHVVQQQVPKEVSPKSKWLKYAGLCLLLIFLTTITVFVVMTYNNTKANDQKVDTGVVVNINGAKTDKQGDLNVNLTTHIVPTSENIKEEIVISDQEEDISTPKARVIYDYASGYVVTKFKDSEDETCYVSEFNVLGSIDGLRSSLESGGNETSVYTNSTEEMYETTGETVNKTLLSPRAAKMCADSQILRVVRSEDDSSDRVKRGCYTRCSIVCVLIYGPHRVRYACFGRGLRRRCRNRTVIGWYIACGNICIRRCSFG